jgi:hypothetical protein
LLTFISRALSSSVRRTLSGMNSPKDMYGKLSGLICSLKPRRIFRNLNRPVHNLQPHTENRNAPTES